MDPTTIFQRLYAAGVRLELHGDRLSASPAARLNDDLRALIRTNKAALVAYLTDAHQTTLDLIEAAQRACDFHGDSRAARSQMRQDIADTPAHLRADLLEHLQAAYPKDKK